MYANFDAEDGNAVVVQLALEQHNIVEEKNRVSTFKQFNGNLLVRWRKLLSRWVDASGICRRVAPVVGLHNLFDTLRSALPSALPVPRVCDLEHMTICLVNGIESVRCVEFQGPSRGDMLNADNVIAKDHLRHGNANLFGERIDGAGLRDGKLAGGYTEAALLVYCRGRGKSLWLRKGFVGVCDVVLMHLGSYR